MCVCLADLYTALKFIRQEVRATTVLLLLPGARNDVERRRKGNTTMQKIKLSHASPITNFSSHVYGDFTMKDDYVKTEKSQYQDSNGSEAGE